MELDTGATVSIIPKQQFKKFQPPLKLEPTELRLKTYTGEVVQPCGFVKASVRYKGQEDVLPLYVVDHNGPPLLGREWLTRLRLDWDNICGVHKLSDPHRSDASKKYEARLKELQAKYSRIFDGTLGKIEGAAPHGSTQQYCSGRDQCPTWSRCGHRMDSVLGGDTRTTCAQRLLQ
ncbi:uncharacterized protein LOC121834226 [Ixodes scapularis]|uniref:uncharacterized protein LOC121834226 n=1 Tax=Ixodes scapularis TaxID=6945 RepID=UPI001A9F9DD1|nr:uncharacterized protein LOC121834226 [Ixodes scapularis]